MVLHLRNDVRATRINRGLSQSELGSECSVTRQTVAAIEAGDYSPSITLALKVAAALNQPITELFWLEEK